MPSSDFCRFTLVRSRVSWCRTQSKLVFCGDLCWAHNLLGGNYWWWDGLLGEWHYLVRHFTRCFKYGEAAWGWEGLPLQARKVIWVFHFMPQLHLSKRPYSICQGPIPFPPGPCLSVGCIWQGWEPICAAGLPPLLPGTTPDTQLYIFCDYRKKDSFRAILHGLWFSFLFWVE